MDIYPQAFLFVHHLETVAGSLPIRSESHLFVLFFSARTTFIRLMLRPIVLFDYIFVAKLQKIIQDEDYLTQRNGIHSKIIELYFNSKSLHYKFCDYPYWNLDI